MTIRQLTRINELIEKRAGLLKIHNSIKAGTVTFGGGVDEKVCFHTYVSELEKKIVYESVGAAHTVIDMEIVKIDKELKELGLEE